MSEETVMTPEEEVTAPEIKSVVFPMKDFSFDSMRTAANQWLNDNRYGINVVHTGFKVVLDEEAHANYGIYKLVGALEIRYTENEEVAAVKDCVEADEGTEIASIGKKNGIYEIKIATADLMPETGDEDALVYKAKVTIKAPEGCTLTKYTDVKGGTPDQDKSGDLEVELDNTTPDGVYYTCVYTKEDEVDPVKMTYHVSFAGKKFGANFSTKVVLAPLANAEYTELYQLQNTWKGNDFSRYTIKVKKLQKHANAEGTEGYWAGLGLLPLCDDEETLAKLTKVQFRTAASQKELAEAEFKTIDLEEAVDGADGKGLAIYVDVEALAGKSKWVGIRWAGTEEVYEFNVSGSMAPVVEEEDGEETEEVPEEPEVKEEEKSTPPTQETVPSEKEQGVVNADEDDDVIE